MSTTFVQYHTFFTTVPVEGFIDCKKYKNVSTDRINIFNKLQDTFILHKNSGLEILH